MNHRHGTRFDSSKNVTSSAQHGVYDSGSHYPENVGPTSTSKMPVYGRRASDDVLRSNLPFIKNVTLQSKNYQGNSKIIV